MGLFSSLVHARISPSIARTRAPKLASTAPTCSKNSRSSSECMSSSCESAGDVAVGVGVGAAGASPWASASGRCNSRRWRKSGSPTIRRIGMPQALRLYSAKSLSRLANDDDDEDIPLPLRDGVNFQQIFDLLDKPLLRPSYGDHRRRHGGGSSQFQTLSRRRAVHGLFAKRPRAWDRVRGEYTATTK